METSLPTLQPSRVEFISTGITTTMPVTMNPTKERNAPGEFEALGFASGNRLREFLEVIPA